MGSCFRKNEIRTNPTESFEEHKVVKHHIRLGIQAGRDDRGEMVVGVKGGIDNFRDRTVVVGSDLEKDREISKINRVNGDNPEQ